MMQPFQRLSSPFIANALIIQAVEVSAVRQFISGSTLGYTWQVKKHVRTTHVQATLKFHGQALERDIETSTYPSMT